MNTALTVVAIMFVAIWIGMAVRKIFRRRG